MKSTMVEVFNQLTHNELADYSLFEDVLGNHFEKFRYFYYMTCDIPKNISKAINSISCFSSEAGILITIEFSSDTKCDEYKEFLESNSFESNFCYAEYFKLNTEIKGGRILDVLIENDEIVREDEIYEDRFNSC